MSYLQILAVIFLDLCRIRICSNQMHEGGQRTQPSSRATVMSAEEMQLFVYFTLHIVVCAVVNIKLLTSLNVPFCLQTHHCMTGHILRTECGTVLNEF